MYTVEKQTRLRENPAMSNTQKTLKPNIREKKQEISIIQ